jgi:DNA-binding transcriptional ArsR family regulator
MQFSFDDSKTNAPSKASCMVSVFDGITYDAGQKAKELFDSGLITSYEGESLDMSAETRAAALARIAELDDTEQMVLRRRPTRGWETERIILLDAADYKTRLSIEGIAAYHEEKDAEVTRILFRLREKIPGLGGATGDPRVDILGSLRMILELVDGSEASKGKLQILLDQIREKETGEVSVAAFTREFGLSRQGVTKHLRNLMAEGQIKDSSARKFKGEEVTRIRLRLEPSRASRGKPRKKASI